MMVRRCRMLLAATILGSMVLGFAPTPVQAETAIASGWWWKPNAGNSAPTPSQVPLAVPLPVITPPPPAPPNVGDGMLVSATPDGADAIAAVRATTSAATLTLTVADNGDTGGQVARLLACQTTSLWTPASAGRWDDKPLVACDASNGGASVSGIRSADGKTWAFAIQALLRDGVLDVAIVPGADPKAPPGTPIAPFSLAFKKPDAGALPASAASADTATTDFSSDFSFGGSSDAPSDFSSPLAGETTFDSQTTFEPTGSTSFDITSVAPTGAVAVPALPRKAQAPLLQQPAAARARALAKPSASDSARFIGFVLILGGLAAAYAATRQPVPAITGLSRMSVRRIPTATKPVATGGGLGRFAKPRSGPPPTLY